MSTHPTTPAALRTIDNLRGPAGKLEALLNVGNSNARFAALVCHPHPLGGGTMHNKVVYHAMKVLHSFGFPVLRFNFRGTGMSEGEHANGSGEREDVLSALDWLTQEYSLPILFAGFSFGANVGLHACCGDPRVRGLIGLGIPVQAEGRDYSYDFLAKCPQPKLFVSGMLDEYGPVDKVEAVVAAAAQPSQLIWVAGADHFFAGKLEDMRIAIHAWIKARFIMEEK